MSSSSKPRDKKAFLEKPFFVLKSLTKCHRQFKGPLCQLAKYHSNYSGNYVCTYSYAKQ